MSDSSLMKLFDAAVAPIARMSTTRANNWAGLVADATTAAVLIFLGLRHPDIRVLPGMATLAAGLLVFSLIEYCFHRWLFHGGPVRAMEQGHNKHHLDPKGDDSLPFFLPPLIMLVLTGMFMLVLPTGYALLLAGAIALGYSAYGLSHFSIHYMRFRRPLTRRWAAIHHIHHHHPDKNFGVTTPLWDIVLGTRYVSDRPRSRTT